MKAVGYGETIPRMKGLECETISNFLLMKNKKLHIKKIEELNLLF